MSRSLMLFLTAALLTATAGGPAHAENNFLNQFRYDKTYDQPKYTRFKNRSRNINNFGESTNRTFGSNNGSGLYFESERISQPGYIGLKREDQKTQVKLKIKF